MLFVLDSLITYNTFDNLLVLGIFLFFGLLFKQ